VAVEEHVDRLLDKIPAFSDACKKFATESQAVNTKLVEGVVMGRGRGSDGEGGGRGVIKGREW
jgi:hypothetical protein